MQHTFFGQKQQKSENHQNWLMQKYCDGDDKSNAGTYVFVVNITISF